MREWIEATQGVKQRVWRGDHVPELAGPMLEDATLFVTGGTGTFGTALLDYLVEHIDFGRVVVFSRDELKQDQIRRRYADDRIQLRLGDVRDSDGVRNAMRGADYVVHAAALKRVDTGEYHPFEFVKTNLLGAQNVIEAARANGVRKVVALSTDKASSPINLYGATKCCSDRMFVAANLEQTTRFSVARYGNVIGSRGSVIPTLRELRERGEPLPITDKRMTRFWIGVQDAVAFILQCLKNSEGGELYVPKIPSMRLLDLMHAIAPDGPFVETSVRPGEKLHEEMIAADEAHRTFALEDQFVMLPAQPEIGLKPPAGAVPVPDRFAYQSDNNDCWLSTDDLVALLERG